MLVQFKFTSLIFLMSISIVAIAEKIDVDTIDNTDYLLLALTPLHQQAFRLGEGTNNYELDVIGQLTIRNTAQPEAVGDTRVAFWFLRNENISGKSASTFSAEAGLLWDTNTGDAPVASDVIGVLALQQMFLNNKVIASVGKLYPGSMLVESDYSGDDRTAFFSQINADDAVGRYFDRIGLGASIQYFSDNWFASGVLTDATAENDLIDFDTLSNGQFLYAIELGYTPLNEKGVSVFSLVPYYIDETENLSKEHGLATSFTHEFGNASNMAVFGRYTFRSGGDSKNIDGAQEEKPLLNGGFFGLAWNNAFGYPKHQVAAQLMTGKPGSAKRAQGFNDQYGLEVFWKISSFPIFELTPDIQLLNNKDNELEIIAGFRAKLFWFRRAEST